MKQEIKREKEENWKKAINFIPKKGELIIYDCSEEIKLKIGDGITHVNDLPFSNNMINLLDGILIMKEEVN